MTGAGESLRLPELIAALSLGIDLGLGQPTEHVLRSCLIATRLGELVDASPPEREVAYYAALLSSVGCTADSSEVAEWFGDDNAFRGASYHVDLAGLPLFGFMLRRAGAGSSPWQRLRVVAALITEGNRGAQESMAGHCDVAATLAEQLGLGRSLYEPMRQIFARWDGKGQPRIRGEQIALPVRMVQLADAVEAYRTAGGPEAAVAMARRRAGTQFDPGLVSVLDRHSDEILAGLDAATTWDDVVAAEPIRSEPITEDRLDDAFAVIADFADLKSAWFRGHSRGVAGLSAAAATLIGVSPDDVATIRRAALAHDLGRTGVPNTIWDAPRALNDHERERVRLHPYFTERALARPAALARVGRIAASHHERADGSGYHRGLGGSSLSPLSCLLAAADAYHAMTEPRPHRPALLPDAAARELRREVDAGRFDRRTAEAVLEAAGHRRRVRRRSTSDSLTPRELEVLVLLARGASNREIARRLVISPKTAGNHVEHIYAKIAVSTRAAAALYAMREGLLDTLVSLQDEANAP